ncbi:MAG: hypothetical protein OEN56_12940 [Gemmatimonadota bacterium]|nr:hypothetical protein [Gemmatimonadota bacterium]
MKQRLFLPFLCVAAFTVAGCSESPTAFVDSTPSFATGGGNPVIASASGGGHSRCATTAGNFYNCDPTNPEGELRTFSFNATMHLDGTVKGRAQLKNRENGAEGRADVICLRFSRPNLAWIIIDEPHVFGTPVTAMAVEDNGEGGGAPPDRMTVFFPAENPEWVCDGNAATDGILNFIFDNPGNRYDVANGNFQVRPPAVD